MEATIEKFWIAGRKRSQNQEPVGVKVILSWILLSPTRLTKLNHQRKKKKKKEEAFSLENSLIKRFVINSTSKIGFN